MSGRYAERLIRTLGADTSDVGPGTDADLLRSFASTRDAGAFESLVRRYGPLVMGVCRRVLGRAPESEDAFQATFLVLARKAGSVTGNLGGWLHTTAHRVALRARHASARRAQREQHMDPMPPVAVVPQDPDRDEVLAALDREIRRLPEKYRVPVVRCELQGRSRAEVACELGIPEGTLSSRLGAARKLLAERLARHHPTLTARGLALLLLSAGTAHAFPRPDLIARTVDTAVPFAAGSLASPLLTPAVRSLAEGALSHMFAAKLTSAIVLAVLLAGFGGVRLSANAGAAPDTAPAPRTVLVTPNAAPQEKQPDLKTEPKKKAEVKNDEPKKDPTAPLKARLKKYDDEIGRIRETMLKEVEAEEKRINEEMKKAEKTRDEAQKAKNFDAANKAFQTQSALRTELMKVQQVRNEIQNRIRTPEPAPAPPPDERLGLRLSAPSAALTAQLGLEKDQGLVIDSVKANSAATKSGLLAHDILLKVDGKPVPNTVIGFRKVLTDLKPDATVEAVVLRKGKSETVKGLSVPPVAASKDE